METDRERKCIPRQWVRIHKIIVWSGVAVALLASSCLLEWALLGGIGLILAGSVLGWWKCHCPCCGSWSVLQHLRYSGPSKGYCPRCGWRVRYDDEP